MVDNNVVKNFIDEICNVFPEVKPLIDNHEDFMITSKMEAFSQATCDAFANGNIELAKKYLSYIDAKLVDSHPIEFEYIDVYYVEHLFWNSSELTKEIGWPLVPPKLQDLYVKFHGKSAV